MAARRMAKATVKKAHRIADAVKRRGQTRSRRGRALNPYAIGMATAKKAAAKRRRQRTKGRRRRLDGANRSKTGG